MIKLTNINKYFISNNKRIDVLKNVNIQFPDHGLISIVGKSGSGKTTLLNIISGLLKPDEGEYLLLNKDTSSFNNNDWCKIRGKYFSYVFQNYNLIDNLTLIDNLKLAALNNEIEISEEEIDKVLEQYGILELKNKPIYELSGGEAQRGAIVRSIITNSKIVLADEPTGALDEENAVNVFESLKELGKTKLVIVVTHDTDFAYKYSDSIIKISYGNIVENTIISGENSGNDLEISDDNFSLKRAKKFSKIVLKKDKRKQILSISLFSIIMSLIMFLCQILFYDADRYAYKAISETDNRVYITANWNICFWNPYLENPVDNSDMLSYNLEPIYSSVFTDLIIPLPEKSINKEIFNNVLVNNSLNDGEIIVSDHILEILKKYKFLNYENTIEVEGKEFSFGDVNLLIKKVNIFDDKQQASVFTFTSDMVEMNEKTLKILANHLTPHEIDYLKYYNELAFNKYTKVYGNKDLKNKQIAISDLALAEFSDSLDLYNNDYLNFINDYLYSLIEITINGVTEIYEISSIFNCSDSYAIILSDDEYYNHFKDENLNLNNYSVCYYSEVHSYSEYVNLLNYSQTTNVCVIHTYDRQIRFVNLSISDRLFSTAIFLFVFFTIFYAVFALYSNKTYLSLSKRNISILYFLGYDKKWIKTCYHGNNIDTNVISYIIGTIFSFGLFILLNFYLGYPGKDYAGIDFNWLVLLLSFFAFIGFVSLILEILLQILFKKSMILIMKGEE